MKRVKTILLVAVFCAQACIASAKTVDFELALDRNKISLGSIARLNLVFSGSMDTPAPELPQIEGVEMRYLGPSTSFSFVNGKTTSSITHMYTLIPSKIGTFKIGPFQFDHKGDTYTSNSATIEVVEGQVRESEGPRGGSVTSDTIKERVFLMIETRKEKIYVNESFSVTVRLYVNGLALRDIQFPEFDHEGFSVSESIQPRQYQEVLNGVQYDVVEFDTVLFGVRPGAFQLGPASLKCNLLVRREGFGQASSDFEDFFSQNIFSQIFGRYETYPLQLKSESVLLSVLPLPEEGKPSGFSGAIGDFQFQASATPQNVKVGDPVTLSMVVTGTGNFSAVSCPKLSSEAGFKIYEPQMKLEPGKKSFEQVLMPLKEDVTEIPAVTFDFFNSSLGQYQSMAQGPFPIKVSKSEQEGTSKIIESSRSSAASLPQEEALGRDIVFIKESLGSVQRRGGGLYRSRVFWAFQGLPVLGFLIFFVFHRRDTRLRTDTRYARLLRAPKKARAGLRRAKDCLKSGDLRRFYDEVFLTLREYLGNKFHLPFHGITEGIVDEVLAPKGVSADVLDRLRKIFKECDQARYAASTLGLEDMARTLAALEDAIDYFQRQRS